MTDRRIRHLPVCDERGLIGIVSIGDLVKTRIDQLEREREQLASYISRLKLGSPRRRPRRSSISESSAASTIARSAVSSGRRVVAKNRAAATLPS